MIEQDNKNWLDLDIESIRREMQEAAARVRAEGREPAPTSDQWGTLCPVFSFSLRWPESGSDDIEVRLSAKKDDDKTTLIWGEGWPEHGARISGVDLLSCLSENWKVIAQDFLIHDVTDSSDEVILDFSQAIGHPELPKSCLKVAGPEITIITDNMTIPLKSESAIVVEVLLTLGSLIAKRLKDMGIRSDITDAWEKVYAVTDLLPAAIEICPDDYEVEYDPRFEAIFWAKKLKQDVHQCRQAAIWLMARQWLFAAGNGIEPHYQEWDVETVPDGLPTSKEIFVLAKQAIDGIGDGTGDVESFDDFEKMALWDRNDRSRQLILYRDWPKRYKLKTKSNFTES